MEFLQEINRLKTKSRYRCQGTSTRNKYPRIKFRSLGAIDSLQGINILVLMSYHCKFKQWYFYIMCYLNQI